MSDVLTISLGGQGAGCLTEQFDAAGIKYEKLQRPPGVIYAAAGDILHILHDSAPYAAIASVLVAWVRAKANRVITITTKDYKVIHAKGYNVTELEEVLRITNRVSAIDPTKREPSEPRGPRLHIESDEE